MMKDACDRLKRSVGGSGSGNGGVVALGGNDEGGYGAEESFCAGGGRGNEKFLCDVYSRMGKATKAIEAIGWS